MDFGNNALAFLGSVLDHWAALTGGCVMALISFFHLWKDKIPSRKLLIWSSIAFFVLAFFLTWQDQFELRQTAETDRDVFKEESASRQKRIDLLNYLLLKLEATNKSQSDIIMSYNKQSPIVQGNQASNITVNTDYSSKPINTTQFVGADNNGNVAQLNNSPNASVTQSILNPAAKPKISKIDPIYVNAPLYGAYKFQPIYRTEFSIAMDSSSPLTDFKLNCNLPRSLVFPPIKDFKLDGAGMSLEGGWHYMGTATITFLTSQKVNLSDLNFSVESVKQ